MSINTIQQELIKSKRLTKEEMLLPEKLREAFNRLNEKDRSEYDYVFKAAIQFIRDQDPPGPKESTRLLLKSKLNNLEYTKEENWNAPEDESFELVLTSLKDIVNSAHLVDGQDFLPDMLALFKGKLQEHNPDLITARLTYIRMRVSTITTDDNGLMACYQQVINNL